MVYFKSMEKSSVEKSKEFNVLISPVISGLAPLRIEELGIELSVTCFGDFINPQKVNVNDHEHPCYEFAWLINGEMIYLVDGKKLMNSADNGQAFFLPPGRLHRRYSESDLSIIRSLELAIDPVNSTGTEFVKELNRILEERCFCFRFSAEQETRLGRLQNELFGGRSLKASLVRHELAVFLIDVMQSLLPDQWNLMSVAANQNYSRNDITDYIIMRIDDLVNRPFEMKALTYYFNLSGRHLNRVFFDKYHVSIRKYAAIRRLHHAERLLQNPANSVGDVAKALGFSSASYFISFFKKHKKMTPGEYVARRRQTVQR